LVLLAWAFFFLKSLTLTQTCGRNDFRGLVLALDAETAATIGGFLIPGNVEVTALFAVRIHGEILRNLLIAHHVGNFGPVESLARVKTALLKRLQSPPIFFQIVEFLRLNRVAQGVI
jgi:hypothetical protein